MILVIYLPAGLTSFQTKLRDHATCVPGGVAGLKISDPLSSLGNLSELEYTYKPPKTYQGF